MSELTQADWMVILNPTAANGSAGKAWQQAEKRIRSILPKLTVVHTQHTGHGIQLASNAIQAGFRHLIAVGGDGTNHEVVNGIMEQTVVPSQEIFYTLFPVGTGNDWIRTHGIPRKLESWLDMITHGTVVKQDVGLIDYQLNGQQERRYFANVAGMAYDAFVVRFGDRHRSFLRNRFFYLLLILRCLFKYQLTRATILADGTSISEYFYTINIGIGRYSGGGMQLVPQAIADDGLLALTYAGPVSKLGVILNTWRFYNGTIGKHPKIQTTSASEISVIVKDGDRAVLLEADGEFLGHSPATFSIIGKALSVLVPKKS